jgi:hypothetical protein
MSDFIWILSKDKAEFLGEIGVSETFILPRAYLITSASDLIDKIIWVILRGENDRLVLVIKVEKVDTILEGYYQDDLLIKPDLQSSLRVGSTFNNLASFVTEVAAKAGEGFSKISFTEVEQLSLLLNKNTAVRLISPSVKFLSNFVVDNPPKNQESLARLVSQVAVSSFNFNNIWSDGRNKKYIKAPFASLTKAYIEYKFPEINILEIEKLILDLDPYTSICHRKIILPKKTQKLLDYTRAPRVDTILRILDHNKIFARKFSTSNLSVIDFLDQMKKTEVAERRHQEILRDVAWYLCSQEIQPFQSESIDLAYKLDGTLQVFEIKTANFENAVSQASKGAFQLACYKNALALNYDSIGISLILDDTGSSDLNFFILHTMKTLGISTFFYDGKIPWPLRLPNFPLKIDDIGKL